jgi:hypothetical protein
MPKKQNPTQNQTKKTGKPATCNPQPETRNLKLSTCNLQLATCNL